MSAFRITQRAWALLLAAGKFGLCRFKGRQFLFPFAFKTTRNQAVVGIDGTVAPLATAGFERGPLGIKAPLPECVLAIDFELFASSDGGRQLCRLKSDDEGARGGLVDLNTADIEAIDAAAFDDIFARTMITRRACSSLC